MGAAGDASSSSSWALPSSLSLSAWAAPDGGAETALARQLRALYDEVAGPRFAQIFALGLTGYPLVDAALRCAEATGAMPPLLLPVVAAIWCKHLGRPWHEAMRMLLLRSCDADVPLAALRWQWAAGLLGGVEWGGERVRQHGVVHPVQLVPRAHRRGRPGPVLGAAHAVAGD